MTDNQHTPIDDDTAADLRAALRSLRRLGFSAADLARFEAEGSIGGGGFLVPLPPGVTPQTWRQYAGDVVSSLTGSTKKTYRTYERFVGEGAPEYCDCECKACWAGACGCDRHSCDRCTDRFDGYDERWVHTLTERDLDKAVSWAELRAEKHGRARNARRVAAGKPELFLNGLGARETTVRVVRLVMKKAAKEYGMPNPAADIKAPKRTTPEPRTISEDELTELRDTVLSGGNDPILDWLILCVLLITGFRRAGLLGLTFGHLDPARLTITVVEKGKKLREQPVTRALMDALLAHLRERGPAHPVATTPVLYYRPDIVAGANGTQTRVPHPLTERRLDTLFDRVKRELDWAATANLHGHDLRHVFGKLVERVAGGATAQRALGHAPSTVTDHYVTADVHDVAWALSILTSEEHPLARFSRFAGKDEA